MKTITIEVNDIEWTTKNYEEIHTINGKPLPTNVNLLVNVPDYLNDTRIINFHLMS